MWCIDFKDVKQIVQSYYFTLIFLNVLNYTIHEFMNMKVSMQ